MFRLNLQCILVLAKWFQVGEITKLCPNFFLSKSEPAIQIWMAENWMKNLEDNFVISSTWKKYFAGSKKTLEKWCFSIQLKHYLVKSKYFFSWSKVFSSHYARISPKLPNTFVLHFCDIQKCGGGSNRSIYIFIYIFGVLDLQTSILMIWIDWIYKYICIYIPRHRCHNRMS